MVSERGEEGVKKEGEYSYVQGRESKKVRIHEWGKEISE